MTDAAAPGSWGASWRTWFVADPRRTDLAVALATLALSVLVVAGSPQDFDTGWPEAAAGVGTFVLVLLRRRWPLPLLAIAVAWSAVHVLLWDRPSSLVFAVLVLLATACVRLERLPAILLGVGVGLTLYASALAVSDDVAYGDGRSLIALVWTAAAVGVADATRSWRRYRAAAAAEVRAAVLAAEAHSRRQVTEERLAIARELHDLLAHSLAVMNVQTGAALHLLHSDPDRAEEWLVAARDAGRSVLDELRDLLAVRRDDVAPDGAPRRALPSVDELPALVDRMRATGVAVTWRARGEPRALTGASSLAVYRIVQEALTNAAKHGDGTVALATEWGDDTLDVTVVNPLPAGTPMSTPVTTAMSTTSDPAAGGGGGGHGLVGMRERATANGGTFDAGPTPTGFRVHARMPITTDGAGGVAP